MSIVNLENENKVKFPLTRIIIVMAFAVLISVVGIVIQNSNISKLRKNNEFIFNVNNEFVELKGEFADLPGIVNVAACSGHISWENKYYEKIEKIEEKIANLKEILKDNTHFVLDYEMLNKTLQERVAVSESIFKLVRTEQLKKAQSILYSVEREKLINLSEAQLTDLNNDLIHLQKSYQASVEAGNKYLNIIYIVSILILFSIFAYCISIIIKWKNMINSLHIGMEFEIHQRTTELKDALIREYQASKMASLGEMASGIAHEVNNPLAIISGKTMQISKIIESQSFSDKGKLSENIQKINQNINRIVKIIKGLRSYSRNADNGPLEKCKIDPIIEDALSLCSEKIKMHSVNVNIENYEDIYFNARPTQLCQVLTNMISNSIDAISNLDSKWINLKVNSLSETAYITITDSGNGIPSHVRDKIMQPFFTTKDPGKGTGLGLSICKSIIEEHGGKLWIDHESPNTQFIIELPKYISKEQAA